MAKGETAKVRTLSQKEYIQELKKKAVEEAQEVLHSKGKTHITEELADLQEVIKCLRKALKIKTKDIKKVQKSKNQERGSFKKKQFLISSN